MLIIDRFEGDYAVIETDSDNINILRSELPKGAKEGDCILKSEDGLRYIIDKEGTAARRKRIEEKMNRLFKD